MSGEDGTAGATAAGMDWGPMDQQLNEELKEKRESNTKYRKMLVSDSTYISPFAVHPISLFAYICCCRSFVRSSPPGRSKMKSCTLSVKTRWS